MVQNLELPQLTKHGGLQHLIAIKERFSPLERSNLPLFCGFSVPKNMAPPADSKKRQGSSTSSSGAAKKPKDGVSKQEEVAPLTKNPWKPFTELTDEDLKLPLAISRYIRANGTDPEKFASDKETFDLRPWHGNEQDQFENVVARYFLWMIRLENRLAMKSYRSLFAKLMIFDMVPSMWPNTPGKVGHLTDDELNGRVGDVAKMTGEPTENVRKRLNKWSVMGSKLDVLCQLFGPGCLFFLKENLSNNL